MSKEHESGRVRATLLPYGQQWLDEQDIEAVVQVLRGDFITQGPAIQAFERKVAEYVGAKYAVALRTERPLSMAHVLRRESAKAMK
ncbi:hypothetical protein HMSSN036_23930 [Paenibacillus macerans]|nr:hypothetical protein HMSSN036_23930 [Paenibacillus macerans]